MGQFRVWPDGTTQEAEEAPYDWMSDDYEMIEADNEEAAVKKVVGWGRQVALVEVVELGENKDEELARLRGENARLRAANRALVEAQKDIANAAGIKLAAARMVLMRHQDEPGPRGVLDTFAKLEIALAKAEAVRLEWQKENLRLTAK